jgi:hypothetical protein
MKGIFGEGPIYRGLTLAHRLRLWGSIEEEEEEEENSFTFFGPKKKRFRFFFRFDGQHSRVARWYILKPKIPVWVNFAGFFNGRSWYILWSFGLSYGRLKIFVAIW